MFTSLFSHKHAGRTLSACMVLLTAAFVFSTVSCSQPAADDSETSASIYGTWTSSYDSYAIASSTVTYNDGGYGYGWTGSLESIKETDSTSGYIYVKYTTVGDSMFPSLVDKYIAVSYTSLGSSSVQMANAYKTGGATGESTLAEAAAEFTIDNGYYTYYGAYSK